MAEIRNNNKTTNTTSSRFSFLNRSFTTVNDEKQQPSPKNQKATNLERTVSLRGKVVKKLCSFFEPSKPSPSEESLFTDKPKTLKSTDSCDELNSKLKPAKSVDLSSVIQLPGTEDRVVLYFTSLRGIRRTYEDCYAVRMIFRNFRVWVDERDVSMDIAYRKELIDVLGEKNTKNAMNTMNAKNKNVELPQVFIRGKYVGGAEIIKQLCEYGELGKILEGFPRIKSGFVCESCGDVRFVPCGNCSGSRKVFDDDEGLLKRCLECNENGLARCPNCCTT